ncbi:hypothetical protein D3C79_944940 [compost metagenome]
MTGRFGKKEPASIYRFQLGIRFLVIPQISLLMLVPLPLFRSISPIASNSSYALTTVLLFTFRAFAKYRSDGKGLSGGNVPSAIPFSIYSASCL